MQHQIFVLSNKPRVKERELKFLRAYYRHHHDWLTLITRLRDVHPPIGKYFCSGADVQYFRENDLRREMDRACRRRFPGFYCGIEKK